jgi:hypothetical protein
LPRPTPTVTERSHGTMSPPANTPGWPVIMKSSTSTTPSRTHLESGDALQQRQVGLLAEREDQGVCRQLLELPGGCGNPLSSNSIRSTVSLPSSYA